MRSQMQTQHEAIIVNFEAMNIQMDRVERNIERGASLMSVYKLNRILRRMDLIIMLTMANLVLTVIVLLVI